MPYVIINKNGTVSGNRLYDLEQATEKAGLTGKRIAQITVGAPQEVQPNAALRVQTILRQHNIQHGSYKNRFYNATIPFGIFPKLDAIIDKHDFSGNAANAVHLTFDKLGRWSVNAALTNQHGDSWATTGTLNNDISQLLDLLSNL